MNAEEREFVDRSVDPKANEDRVARALFNKSTSKRQKAID